MAAEIPGGADMPQPPQRPEGPKGPNGNSLGSGQHDGVPPLPGSMRASEVGKAAELPVVEVPAVQVVMTREGEHGTEVFLGRRIAGGFLDQWSVSGGRMDEGESQAQAGIREVREETGVDIAEERLVHLRDTDSSTVREKDGKKARYNYQITVFTVDAQGLDPQNASPDEHAEMKWMTLSDALAMHDEAVAAAQADTESELSPDKIPGALAPRTLETIQFLHERSNRAPSVPDSGGEDAQQSDADVSAEVD